MVTEVIFRKYKKKPHEIIAMFPYEIHSGYDITCYEYLGQHGSSDRFFSKFTSPCKDKSEYGRLLDELINRVGYDDLKIIQRVNHSKYLKAVKEQNQKRGA